MTEYSAGLATKRSGMRLLFFRVWQNKHIYIMLVPVIVFYFIFKYIPIYGVQLAFRRYNVMGGITGSPFAGWENFKFLFIEPDFWRAVRNTITLTALQLIIFFPFSVFLALLLNELRSKKLKRVLQTTFTFPHFLSWVIISGICLNLFGSVGAINNLLSVVGLDRVPFLTNAGTFRWFLILTLVWKEAGWSCILYLAAITAIDPALYEAAIIDGANRWHRMRYITWPGISMIVAVTLILRVGAAMDAGFEQIFNLYNPTVYSTSDIIDTFVYRISFQRTADFGVSTAAGLFKGVTNCVLLVITDFISRRVSGTGIV